jgi:CheY-like chemotaxis protein
METTVPARRILIVEEDHALNAMLAGLLREEGYQADAAFTLEQALRMVEDQLYDLVLTDHLVSTPPRHGSSADLSLVHQLRHACHPTPVGVLSAWPLDQQAVERAGFAFALQKPFDIDTILRLIADFLNPTFTPEQAQQAQHLRRFLEAISQGNEAVLRILCAPTVAYYSLTHNVFTPQHAILGIEAYLVYLRLVRARLPVCRIEQVAIFAHRGRLRARHLCSWQTPVGRRVHLSWAVQCRFRGERITQVGEALPTRRLRELLETTEHP